MQLYLVPRVIFFNHLCEVTSIYVHVYLRSGNTFMTQHLLNGPEIGAVLQKMCGKGVTKSMRTYFFIHAYLPPEFFDDLKYHGPAEPRTPLIEE